MIIHLVISNDHAAYELIAHDLVYLEAGYQTVYQTSQATIFNVVARIHIYNYATIWVIYKYVLNN